MVAYTFKQKGITNMSRNLTKSILSRDEISLLLNSEETKNKSLYGNLFDVLNAIKNMKAVTISDLQNLDIDKTAIAALTYNKKSLLENVKNEWYVESDSSEECDKKVRCGLCNAPNKYLFYIRNRINGKQVNVGSTCMTKFPDIQGYTDYKYSLTKTMRNQQSIARRTKFHSKLPNAIDVMDSANFYFDNLPILLPYELYKPLSNCVKMLRIIYRDYVNYGKKPFESKKTSFELFEEYANNFNNIKQKSDNFIRKNINKELICRKDEIAWMEETKQKQLIIKISKNNARYNRETFSKMTSMIIIKRYFELFNERNSSDSISLIPINHETSAFSFVIVYLGFQFVYKIDVKKYIKQIGVNCVFESEYKYNNKELFSVADIFYSDSNLNNAISSVKDTMLKFGYAILLDEETTDVYIYRKADKSIKHFTMNKFLYMYNKLLIQKSIDVYSGIAKLTEKNWIYIEEQSKHGTDEKVNSLYYQQYIEPYL